MLAVVVLVDVGRSRLLLPSAVDSSRVGAGVHVVASR